MYCAKCGKSNLSESKFCSSCGARLVPGSEPVKAQEPSDVSKSEEASSEDSAAISETKNTPAEEANIDHSENAAAEDSVDAAYIGLGF